VIEVAGASKESLGTVHYGPGGNPTHGLANMTQLIQKEIGLKLGMTSNQAAQLLHRFRRKPARMAAALRAVGQKVESVNGLLPKP
jgi:hypothetical protein